MSQGKVCGHPTIVTKIRSTGILLRCFQKLDSKEKLGDVNGHLDVAVENFIA